ncbi:Cysteine dioxygenase type I [Saccharopolyspora kobensis]|uniref:Cysteine dioxygenase type I n=1 Tax=Saccharopolyspora kobensis TaxID=146035 RepID=A0A1H6DBR6_9PSEU|nr:cysteine dioxygenase family protein [Saccharopolyspora kobensis]SEG82728.1 Cysteine dioxygenase type I [Saccharopolyspora kobensis]SFE25962.1 Cysteine dioxygenase type I [Saccharopolyspora kobensis]
MTSQLVELAGTIREQVRRGLPAAQTAELVEEALKPFLTAPDLLSPVQRVGDPDHYRQHVLHVESDGSFSIVALVWLPGQRTPVHDHISWCVTGVHEGVEHEQRYVLRGDHLVPAEQTTNHPGEVCGFAPPGDIHLVRNAGTVKAISIHVYGADIAVLGSSVRRCYELGVTA